MSTKRGCIITQILYGTAVIAESHATPKPGTVLLLALSNKMLSYRRETALQSALVLARSGRLELADNSLWAL